MNYHPGAGLGTGTAILGALGQSGVPADTTAPVVTASPAGGSYPVPQTVTLSADETATIRYTTNGSAPGPGSPVYSIPLEISTVTVLKFYAVDEAGNASTVQSEAYSIDLAALEQPPEAWVNVNNPGLPGSAGAWAELPVPLVPPAASPAAIHAVASYQIILADADITSLVQSCSIEESESSVLSSCSVTLPVGLAVSQGDGLSILWADQSRLFVVEEVSGEGPQRTIWGRSSACVLDEPHAAAGSWNGWDNPHAWASDLAETLTGSVPLSWECGDFPLPPVWDLAGTPLAALQQLAAAVGAIVLSTGAGGLIVRDRWPVRPPDLPAQSPTINVSLTTALSLSEKQESGQGWGSITVYGYDPSADLPDLEVEESSPLSGSPVHVRLYWQRSPAPAFNTLLTDGAAAFVETTSAVISGEEVTFDNGRATTRYPVAALHGASWIGADQGAVWQLQNGDRRELSMAAPGGRGIALVNYTTTFERWQLTGQTAAKVIFTVEVGQGGIAATVNLSSGGSIAPAITMPLLGSTAACIAAGIAALDDSRARSLVSAELPLTSALILPGTIVAVDDPTAGVSGNGKVVRVSTTLEPDPKTTRSIEVQVC